MTFSVICLFACKSISVITRESFAVCIIMPLLAQVYMAYIMASESGIVPLWAKRDVFLTNPYGDGEMEMFFNAIPKLLLRPQ